jgi:ankyrin repeat protein
MIDDISVTPEDANGWNRAIGYVERGDTEGLRELLKGSPSLAQMRDSEGTTLLHEAALMDGEECARVLLEAGADMEACEDGYGDRPLHVAAREQCPNVLRLLLDAGADVDALSYNEEAFLFLPDSPGHTALGEIAYDENHYETYGPVVRMLLEHDANQDLGSANPIYWAVWNGDEVVTRLLLENGLDHNLDELLLTAAAKGISFAILLLSQVGANIAAKNDSQETVLHLILPTLSENSVFDADSVQRVEMIIGLGADSTALDVKGRTPLEMDVDWEELPQLQAVMTKAMQDAATPWRQALHAVLSGDLESLGRTLASHPELISAADGDGNTLLHHAPHNSGAAVLFLLMHDAEIEARNTAGETPLFSAVRKDCSNMPSYSYIFSSDTSASALMYAKASVMALNKEGLTPLHLAASLNRAWFLRKFATSEGLCAQDDLGRIPLHHAAIGAAGNTRRIATMNRLVRAGSDPDHLDKNGDSPITLAWRDYSLTEERRVMLGQIMDGLREARDSVKNRGADERTSLHFAAAQGNILSAKLLLMYGADLENWDTNKQTPLHLAVKSGHRTMVRFLLKAGADLEATDAGGYTPFLRAAATFDQNIVGLLSRHGADITRTTHDAKTAIHLMIDENYAVREQRAEMTEFLIRLGVDLNAVYDTMYGENTALDDAQIFGYEEVELVLRKYGGKSGY